MVRSLESHFFSTPLESLLKVASCGAVEFFEYLLLFVCSRRPLLSREGCLPPPPAESIGVRYLPAVIRSRFSAPF